MTEGRGWVMALKPPLDSPLGYQFCRTVTSPFFKSIHFDIFFSYFGWLWTCSNHIITVWFCFSPQLPLLLTVSNTVSWHNLAFNSLESDPLTMRSSEFFFNEVDLVFLTFFSITKNVKTYPKSYLCHSFILILDLNCRYSVQPVHGKTCMY